jgi:hypothetical protein
MKAAIDLPTSFATTVRLTRGQVYFLDRFRARLNLDTGFRIPRAGLLQVLLEVASEAALDLRDVTSEEDLTKLLLDAPTRHAEKSHT